MKKIMFNDKYGLTHAVLRGWKVQTRRILKDDGAGFCDFEELLKKTRYEIGDVVAIAQSYRDVGVFSAKYENGMVRDCCDEAGWKNKMFVQADLMPHQIKILNMRVEHLQQISDEDCMCEGVFFRYGDNGTRLYMHSSSSAVFSTPKEAFASLIDKVCKKGTWDKNPLVLVYEFRLLK